MKVTFQIVLSCLSLATVSFGAEGKTDWQSVDQPCGQIQSVKVTKRVIRQKDGRVETQLYETPIPNARIALYRVGLAEQKCCDQKELKAETVSGRWGNFTLPHVNKGKYWLVVTKEKQRYEMPIVLTDDYNEQRCNGPNSAVVRTFWMDAVPYSKIEIHVH
jgi:hypothetical protein